ncbi:MAG: radical SAM protein [Pseudomonadota bacterium]
MKPFIIPFFISHQGCPHRCLYCDQHRSGGRRPEPATPESVRRGLTAGLASPRLKPGVRVEAAFYGGTFTALPRSRQEVLLNAAAPFLKQGLVHGLRLSTRPDALDRERLAFLRSKGVVTVEIGAQSMDDRVLEAAGRGHTCEQTRQAAGLVKEAGLRLGLQLLLGLPREDDPSRDMTLQSVLDLAPDDVRLYPLLVLQGTPLAGLYRQGLYDPLSLEQAVSACARMYRRLTRNGVSVIRLGLQPTPELEMNLLAGPYHPSFGHLVAGEVFARRFSEILAGAPAGRGGPIAYVAPQDLSPALGHGRANLKHLSAELPGLNFKPDPSLPRGWIRWQGREYHLHG